MKIYCLIYYVTFENNISDICPLNVYPVIILSEDRLYPVTSVENEFLVVIHTQPVAGVAAKVLRNKKK